MLALPTWWRLHADERNQLQGVDVIVAVTFLLAVFAAVVS